MGAIAPPSSHFCQPRKKKPPRGELTEAEKRTNRKLAQIRVKVEHDLAGVKRSRIVKDVLRNTKTVCQMQSWKRPVDYTTFEARIVSGGSKPNENLIPEKV